MVVIFFTEDSFCCIAIEPTICIFYLNSLSYVNKSHTNIHLSIPCLKLKHSNKTCIVTTTQLSLCVHHSCLD